MYVKLRMVLLFVSGYNRGASRKCTLTSRRFMTWLKIIIPILVTIGLFVLTLQKEDHMIGLLHIAEEGVFGFLLHTILNLRHNRSQDINGYRKGRSNTTPSFSA